MLLWVIRVGRRATCRRRTARFSGTGTGRLASAAPTEAGKV